MGGGGGNTVIGMLSYYDLVKFFLEDEVWSILI